MKLARNSFVKFLAALVAMGCLSACAISFLATTVLYRFGGYEMDSSATEVYSRMVQARIYEDLYEAADYYILTTAPDAANSQELWDYKVRFDPDNSNFFFTITDYDTGNVLLQNYQGTSNLSAAMSATVVIGENRDVYDVIYHSFSYPIVGSAAYSDEDAVDTSEITYRYVQVDGYVRSSVTQVYDDYTEIYYLSNTLFSWRMVAAAVTALSAVVALASLIFLLYGAGRRKGTEEIDLRIIDRIPADLFLCLMGGIAVGGGVLFILTSEDYFYHFISNKLFYVIGFWSLPTGLWLVIFLSSFAARFKVKGWWRNTLVWRVWNWFGELLHHPIRNLFRLLRQLHLVWKAAIAGVAIAIVEFWCLMAFYHGWILPIFGFNVVMALAAAYCCVCMVRLRNDCRKIADGDLSHSVDTRGMVLDFKDHGEDLSRIRDGIALAVEDRLRSERFKTELITNVSHDLKTPLTSIVNYVDLLSRLELPDQAAEYVEVLRRQSARLKKLTEDLVEASKASTGSLPVTCQPVRLEELLGQVTAEYSDRFDAAGLHGVAQLPDETLTVLADGRYLWRVMDNLLSNVCKYALPGTRVYITAQAQEGKAVIAVKNISRDKLNISAEELMERFVRGDASRNTEGSGLGLSIAQSLCALMGGALKLTVDGDLFKAEVDLPLA